jgi:hypothetical protein
VEIKEKRIQGADYNLHIEDEIVYGFMSGNTTRFRMDEGHISGTAGGHDLMLNVWDKQTTTRVTGLVGGARMTASVSDHRILVKGNHGSLLLNRDRGNHLSGRLALSGMIETAHLTTYGCGLGTFRERPELIVVLFMWWLGG